VLWWCELYGSDKGSRKYTKIGFHLIVTIRRFSFSIQVERRVVEEDLWWLMTLTGGWHYAATGLEKADINTPPLRKKEENLRNRERSRD
jgi:hypothetical protein